MRYPLCILGVLMVCPFVRSQTPADQPGTNLTLVRALAERVASQVADSVWGGSPDTVRVVILPPQTAWYIRPSLFSALTAKNLTVLGEGSAHYDAEFGMNDLGVRYLHPRSDGWFGSTVVSREVFLSLNVTVIENGPGNVLFTRTITETTMDTLAISSIPDVENPNLPFTQGEVPEEGLFSNMIEPLIILGTVAVAVFLLFHVRS